MHLIADLNIVWQKDNTEIACLQCTVCAVNVDGHGQRVGWECRWWSHSTIVIHIYYNPKSKYSPLTTKSGGGVDIKLCVILRVRVILSKEEDVWVLENRPICLCCKYIFVLFVHSLSHHAPAQQHTKNRHILLSCYVCATLRSVVGRAARRSRELYNSKLTRGSR